MYLTLYLAAIYDKDLKPSLESLAKNTSFDIFNDILSLFDGKIFSSLLYHTLSSWNTTYLVVTSNYYGDCYSSPNAVSIYRYFDSSAICFVWSVSAAHPTHGPLSPVCPNNNSMTTSVMLELLLH